MDQELEERVMSYLMDLYDQEIIELGSDEAAHSMARRVLIYAEMDPQLAIETLEEYALEHDAEETE